MAMTKKAKRKMMRNAAKAPRWLRDVAAVNFDPNGRRAHKIKMLGSLGAASEVRHIDPNTGEKLDAASN